MATYRIRQLKNGSWSCTLQIKKKENNKDKFITKTIKLNKEIITERKANQEAICLKNQWEKETKSIDLENITFNGLADIWLNANQNKHSQNYQNNARRIIKSINNFWGEKRVRDITSNDVQSFFDWLNNYKFITTTYILKDNKSLENKIKQYQLKNLVNDSAITKTAIYYARHYQNVKLNTANAICKVLNVKLNDYFREQKSEKLYYKETKLKYRRVMCAILNFGIIREIISINYANGTFLKKKVEGEKKEKVIFNKNQLSKLLALLETKPIEQAIPIYLLATLGIRNCELCGLEWKDVNFETKKIKICRDRVFVPKIGIITSATKTKSSVRDLSMPELLQNKLMEYKSFYENKKFILGKLWVDSDTIFCNELGAPRFPSYSRTLLSKFEAEANLPHIEVHKLRHTWITLMIENGVPINDVSKFVGHSKPTVTLDVYANYKKEEYTQTQIVLNKLLTTND